MIRAAVVCVLGTSCVDDGGPRLETVTPAAAPRDAIVTLTGARLCGPAGDCAAAGGDVQIGLDASMVRAPIVEYSDTHAVIEVPEIVPIGPTQLLVTVNDRASNALDFEVLP